MNKKPFIPLIKLRPVHLEKIWGGTWLKNEFGFKTKGNNIGESWLISAHSGGDCKVLNGFYKGTTLSQLYDSRRDLFADDEHEKFPLLVKFIDAREDLSVQVHPGDEYARKHEGESGKSEAWIILSTKPKTRIQIGHRAKTREDLRRLVEEGRWNELLSYRSLTKSELINIPSGTLHAICAGTALLEIQQSSDVTYRLFDYDRLDSAGNKRPLHLQKALDVITTPHLASKGIHLPKTKDSNAVKQILRTPYFQISSLRVSEPLTFYNLKNKYYLIIVLDGHGKIGRLSADKGDSFIITSKSIKTTLKGQMHLIISST
ncbi:MAG TPA: class I mannose-6-phosphate isomerase [Bacilli bacterium]|jgi:mannose-6-phosphate isomerase|nr:class I mannose-6-phosphate isomerase [Bacilli bacterium]